MLRVYRSSFFKKLPCYSINTKGFNNPTQSVFSYEGHTVVLNILNGHPRKKCLGKLAILYTRKSISISATDFGKLKVV